MPRVWWNGWYHIIRNNCGTGLYARSDERRSHGGTDIRDGVGRQRTTGTSGNLIKGHDMKVLIIGGGGVIGQKLARKLADRGHLQGADIAHMTLADVVNPAPITAGFPVDVVRVDISDRASVDELIAGRYDVIYLLAAIVSAHAEEDFDAGMNINLFGSYHVFEAVRALGTKPV